jgi:hypothetical protein
MPLLTLLLLLTAAEHQLTCVTAVAPRAEGFGGAGPEPATSELLSTTTLPPAREAATQEEWRRRLMMLLLMRDATGVPVSARLRGAD